MAEWEAIRALARPVLGRRYLDEGRYWYPVLDERGRQVSRIAAVRGAKKAFEASLALEREAPEEAVRVGRKEMRLPVVEGFELEHYDAAYGEAEWSATVWSGSAQVGTSDEDKWIGEIYEELDMPALQALVNAVLPRELRRPTGCTFQFRARVEIDGEESWERGHVYPYGEVRRVGQWADMLTALLLSLARQHGYGQVTVLQVQLVVTAGV